LLSFFIKLQIQLVLGDESSISVGWQKKDEKRTATGEIKVNFNDNSNNFVTVDNFLEMHG
jgi:hypothetical protein